MLSFVGRPDFYQCRAASHATWKLLHTQMRQVLGSSLQAHLAQGFLLGTHACATGYLSPMAGDAAEDGVATQLRLRSSCTIIQVAKQTSKTKADQLPKALSCSNDGMGIAPGGWAIRANATNGRLELFRRLADTLP